MPHSPTLSAVLLGISTLLVSAPAHAVTPRIYYQGSASATDSGPYHAPQDSESGTTGGPATYHAVSGANSSTSITDSAFGGSVYSTATGTSEIRSDGYSWAGGAGAQSTIVYYGALVGSTGPINPAIPVRVEAAGYVDGIPFGEATASFILKYYDGGAYPTTFTKVAQIYYNGSGTRSFDIDQVINILPNTEIVLTLNASVGAKGPDTGPGSSWATAYVDPTFTIDPAYAADYHFEGIPSVPEPMSAALLLAGLGVIMATRRRSAKV